MSTMTERKLQARLIITLPFAIAAITGVAYLFNRADQPSMAKGAMIGGGAMIVALAVAAIAGKRGPGRVALRLADERENGITDRSFAHAALVMGAVAVGCMIAAAYGLSGVAVSGAILWAGALAFAISFTVQTRRR